MWVTNLYNGLAFLLSGPLNCELCILKKKKNLTFYLAIEKKRFCFFDVFKHANDFFFRFWVLLESYFLVGNLFFLDAKSFF